MPSKLQAAALLALLAFALPAHATTIKITGVVSGIGDFSPTLSLDASVAVNTPFQITYTYNPALPDNDPDPTNGIFAPISSYLVTVGNYSFFSNTPGGDILTHNNFNNALDLYNAEAGLPDGYTGNFGATPSLIAIQLAVLESFTLTANNTDALIIPTLANFADLHTADIYLRGTTITNYIDIALNIQTLQQIADPTPRSVPLPAAALPGTLLLAALATTLTLKKRNK